MSYIGNTPADKFLTLTKQNFSTSATTSYTLDSSISSTQDIALFINNVRQSPVDAYTVSGTALTLTSATAGTDEMYCVYLGKTVGTVVPGSNTITNAMMTDDSVGIAELSATGTPSSSNFLRGDNSWTAVNSVGGATGVDFNDNVKARFGTDNDMEVYHDGGNGFVKNSTGQLDLRGQTVRVRQATADETFIQCNANTSVDLYYDNAVACKTSSTGMNWLDSKKATFGTSSDLEIYHDGANSFVTDSGTGSLYLQASDNIVLRSADAGETYLTCADDGAVKLYNNNTIHFETSGSGCKMNDSIKLLLGDSEDFKLYHDGGHSYLENAGTGVITVKNNQTNNTLNVYAADSNFGQNVLNIYTDRNSTGGTFDLIEGANGGGTTLRVFDDGSIQNSTNSYGQYSDERIKQNIIDASSQWEDIKALKVRKFKLKREVERQGEDNTPYQIGVIAQELESSNMNGLVQETQPCKQDVALNSDFGTIVSGTADNGAEAIRDKDGKITGYEDVFTKGQTVKAVKYSVLYMKAIKCLQESMERIETLEAKVTALENK
ncbi:hypothetical protein [uncultured Mediterranean phage]|nr:hypothetical protein [uncultured Mediterranean phage]